MYSKVIQLYTFSYTHIYFFLTFFSAMVYYRILNTVPRAMQLDLVYFIYSSLYLLIPNT